MCDDILLEKKRHRSPAATKGAGGWCCGRRCTGSGWGSRPTSCSRSTAIAPSSCAPLVGLGRGLGLSLAATSNTQLTVGEAWTIITGLDYGTHQRRALGGRPRHSNKGVVGTAVATSVAATSIGVLVANAKSPSAGDIEVVRSGLLWGTVGGSLATFAIAPDAEQHGRVRRRSPRRWTSASSLGVGLANCFDLSRNRVLIIDAGALAGGLSGLGIAWLAAGTDNSGRGLAAAGLARHAGRHRRRRWATRDLDAQDAGSRRRPSLPAVLARDAAGRWRFGTPGALPVFDGTGSRLVGATFSAVGGLF